MPAESRVVLSWKLTPSLREDAKGARFSLVNGVPGGDVVTGHFGLIRKKSGLFDRRVGGLLALGITLTLTSGCASDTQLREQISESISITSEIEIDYLFGCNQNAFLPRGGAASFLHTLPLADYSCSVGSLNPTTVTVRFSPSESQFVAAMTDSLGSCSAVPSSDMDSTYLFGRNWIISADEAYQEEVQSMTGGAIAPFRDFAKLYCD